MRRAKLGVRRPIDPLPRLFAKERGWLFVVFVLFFFPRSIIQNVCVSTFGLSTHTHQQRTRVVPRTILSIKHPFAHIFSQSRSQSCSMTLSSTAYPVATPPSFTCASFVRTKYPA